MMPASDAGPGRAGTLGALALALVTALAGPAAAQEGASGGPGDRGWIGVGIRQAVRCDGAAAGGGGEARCRPVVIAEAVIRGAPAARAGLQPGDTLIAVNGRALSRRSGQDELLSFQPGQPAQLLVGRPGGRASLRVVPERRPREAGSAPVWVEPGKAPDARSMARARVLAQPDSGPGKPGVMRLGSAGELQVEAFRLGDDGDLYVEWSEGDSVRLRRLEEVAPRLRELRDSVFSAAQEQLAEIRKHQREALRRAMDARRERAREVREDRESPEVALPLLEEAAPPPLPPAARLRVAGAEFRPLTPALAEYFPGADHGLLVLQVVPGTPADVVGLRSGDVVVEVGDRRIFDASDLRAVLSGYPSSGRDTLVVRWVRKGDEMEGTLRQR